MPGVYSLQQRLLRWLTTFVAWSLIASTIERLIQVNLWMSNVQGVYVKTTALAGYVPAPITTLARY